MSDLEQIPTGVVQIIELERWECGICSHRWSARKDRPPKFCPKCFIGKCDCDHCRSKR